MPRDHTYCVYILASKSRCLYVGMTNSLEVRVWQHKSKSVPGFTARYNIDRLIYVADFSDVHQAIDWEKQIKRWSRKKKIALIEAMNPTWRDLSAGWYDGIEVPATS